MNPKRPTAGIILAAGISKRFGRPKQLLRLDGKPLIAWVLEAALASNLHHLVLVLGHESEAIEKGLGNSLCHPRLQTVINADYDDGMASSLRAGLMRVREDHPSVMFLLGDQPLLGSKIIDLLLESFWSSDRDICVPVHRGRRGNPALFSSRFYDRLLHLRGDQGAREIIEENPEQVLRVEIGDPRCLLDIDREEDLRIAESLLH